MNSSHASSHTASAERRAVVIGGSLAGLLAARVLSEHFDDVVLLERDPLPAQAAPRKGTPHAVHPHGLLARGRQAIEELFPGFTDALEAQGALLGDIGTDIAVDANRARFARRPAGVTAFAASRLAIEGELRRRVRAIRSVQMLEEVDVQAPLHADGRVTGVRFSKRSSPAVSKALDAALVVDCTGRGSHSPAWLVDWGFDAPAEDRVAIGLAYTSAYFRREESVKPPISCVVGTATAALPRPSILIAQEPDDEGRARWVAGVGGYAGDHVDTTLEAMRRRAADIGNAEIEALAAKGELVGSVMRYQFSHSQRRHYERLRRFPSGYLVMGDALASFNPIYGQGMTVAACEALALRDALSHGTTGLARRYFKAAAKVIDIPWQLAVGGDLALPSVVGRRPFPLKLINAYVARVQRAAVEDPVVAAAFVRVMHMLAAPPSLFAPSVVRGVLRHGGRADPGSRLPTATA